MSLLGAFVNADRKPAPKTPVPLVSRASAGIWGAFARRDTTTLLSTMESVGTVFGIVDKLAGDTSRIEWKLWQKAKSGIKDDRKEITSHLALDIWSKPNTFFTRQELVESGQQHGDLTGEIWLVVARDQRAPTIPLELWPVRPDRMRPIPDPDKFLLGYMYRSPDGEEVALERKDVLYIRRPDPNDIYRGLGPLRASLVDVDSSKYAAEWNRNFFLNSAEPGGIIEVPTNLTDDQFDEMRERWHDQHRGVANAHRVAILEHGKWVNKGYPSMRDMQFAELRGVTSAAIREAFGFPKFMLGDVTDVNRSNADASEAMFAKHLIVPRLERWKQMLNNDYLPLFGTAAAGLEFDYENPVSEDGEAANASRDSRVGAVASLVPLGFDAQETLKAFDLPPIKFEKPEPPAPPVPPPGAAPGQRPPVVPANVFAELTARLFNAVPDEEMAGVQADFEQVLGELNTRWAAEVAPEQHAAIVAQVQDAVDSKDLPALADMEVPTGGAVAVILAALVDLARRAARRMVNSLRAQGAPTTPPVTPPPAELESAAATTAGILAAGLTVAAASEALRLAVPGASGAEVAQGVGTYIATTGSRTRDDEFHGALTRVQNESRLLTAEPVPQIIYSASEILDARTCRAKAGDPVKRCHEIDGHVYANWKAAWDDYAGGTYKHCKGRKRCRGTVKATWNPEAPL